MELQAVRSGREMRNAERRANFVADHERGARIAPHIVKLIITHFLTHFVWRTPYAVGG